MQATQKAKNASERLAWCGVPLVAIATIAALALAVRTLTRPRQLHVAIQQVLTKSSVEQQEPVERQESVERQEPVAPKENAQRQKSVEQQRNAEHREIASVDGARPVVVASPSTRR